MSMHRRVTPTVLCRPVLLAVLLLALPMAVTAQRAPASSSSSSSMDVGSMRGMDHGAMSATVATATAAPPAAVTKAHGRPIAKPAAHLKNMHDMHHPVMLGMDHQAMSGMDHAPPPDKQPASSGAVQGMSHDTMPAMDHGSMPGMIPQTEPTMQGDMSGSDHHAMPGMDHPAAQGGGSTAGTPMGPMQGSSPPPDARSPDYSDGLGYIPTHGVGMHDNGSLGMLLIDQLEAFHDKHGSNGQAWELQGWYGNDGDKLWLRSEGDRRHGKVDDGDVELFWNRNVTTFWSTQLGVRHEFGEGPDRNWAAFGVQGLAPYWFELEATGYVAPSGRTAARLRAEYELLFTQRLILQPEFEINLYGRNDPARGVGRGIADTQLGLRLRYEIRRQLAPYIGVVWTRRYGATADYARQDGEPLLDRRWVAGVRIWF